MTSAATADTLVDAADAGPESSARRGRLEYIGGLDGIRAAAVVVVMIGHMPYKSDISFTYLDGGYLGVSTFFTLSGFLITRLLLAEWASGAATGRTGRVDLRQFWTRRAKRLLPALYVCIAAAMVLSLTGVGLPEVDLGKQIVATLLYFKNGYALYLDGTLGAALFPLWSLSIEEQFYLVFPLLFVAATRWLGRRAVWIFAVLGVASYLHMHAVSTRGTYGGWSTAYYSTLTRASEILAGVVLAYVVTTARFERLRHHPRFHLLGQALGVIGGLATLWIWNAGAIRWDTLHQWTLLCSLATVCLIVACLCRGPVTWALELRPIRWMGRVSYGAYLYQILVFFCVTEDSTGIHNTRVLMVVRIAAVFAVAGVSHRFIEAPLRHRREPQGWRLVFSYGGVAVLLAVLALTLPFPKATVVKLPPGPFSESNSVARFDATRLQVTGDLRLDEGLPALVEVARKSSGDLRVFHHTGPLCPMVPTTQLVLDGRLRRPDDRCVSVAVGIRNAAGDRPDVVVFSLGLADLLDHVSEDGEVTHLGQETFDFSVVSRLQRYLDSYRNHAAGAPVAWVLLPEDPAILDQDDLGTTVRASDPTDAAVVAAEESGRLSDDEVLERIRHWNSLVRKVARTKQNVVLIEDFEPTESGWQAVLDDPRLDG